VGEDGETHTGAFDLSFLRCVPNLVVMAPADESEMRNMIYTAVEYDGPIALRYPRGAGEGVPIHKEFHLMKIGKGALLREGKDVALLAVGRMVGVAQKAADLLEAEGIAASVANMRFVKPLDEELLAQLAVKTKAFVTLEENAAEGGFGSAVAEYLEQKGWNDVSLKIIGLPDEFIEHGKPQTIREKYGLDPAGVAETVATFMENLAKTRRIS
jgi:1-deoxy-D-xylulose-5-phosphate synthase